MSNENIKTMRKIRWILILSAWAVAFTVWQVDRCQEKRAQAAALKLFRSEKTEHVQHLSQYDYLKFQARLEPSRHTYPDYAHVVGKVVRVEGDQVWLRISDHLNFKDDQDKINYFTTANNQLDTVKLSRQAILGTIQKDTLQIPAPDGRKYVLSELLDIQRFDGPLIELNGYSNQSITLRCKGQSGEIVALEPLKGVVQFQQKLPLEIKPHQLVTISHESAAMEVQCRLVLSSEFNPRIVYTVERTKGNQVTLKRQY
jgi:hypothetical protein